MIQLRPSKAAMWTRCAAQPMFEASTGERPESDAAREGTAAAWVADCILRGDATIAADMIDRNHANGWLVTPDMTEHVQGYVNLVRSFGGVVTSEQQVRLNEFIAGTLDSSVSRVATTLITIDLKYGVKIVEAEDNPQLMIYTGAELLRLNDPAITQVTMAIYQPRAFHPAGIYRLWTITVADLWARLTDIVAAGWRCQQPNPVATPGPHCEYCGAASTCAALAHSIYSAFNLIMRTDQRTMTPAELANEWKFLELASAIVKARQSAVNAETEQRMKSGEHLPGLYMEQRFGNRRFKVSLWIVHTLTGVDPYTKTAKTPAALEREGVSVEAMKALTESPSIGFKIARLTRDKIDRHFNES